MLLLGLHSGHDANVTLMRDGEVIVTVESERVLDLKHAAGLGAMQAAVEAAFLTTGVNPAEVDAVIFADDMHGRLDVNPLVQRATHFGRKLHPVGVVGNTELWPTPGMRFSLPLGGVKPETPVHLCCHSMAHAAGALYMAGFEDAAILVYDGYGTCCGTMAYRYDGVEIACLPDWHDRFLMGLRYGAFGWFLREIASTASSSQFLDFAGKVMGLQAYGSAKPDLVLGFREWFTNGDYAEYLTCMMQGEHHCQSFIAPPSPKWNPGLYLNRLSAEDQDSRDIVASMQEAFTQIACEAARDLVAATGSRRLVVSGGCALNIVTNERLAGLDEVEDFFVPPNCDDRGISLGAAALGHCGLTGALPHFPAVDLARRRSPYKGMLVTGATPPALGADVSIRAFDLSDPANLKQMARWLARQRIIGVVQGRSEIGPRALGHRSILTAANDPAMKDHINQRIKKREWWRPFAPVCRAPDLDEYFETPQPDPYMLLGARARERWRRDLGAVTHVDGTARVQAVPDRDANPVLWDLLGAMKAETGAGILLNTSYNEGGKPLVNTRAAALSMLSKTGMDATWIEGTLYFKPTITFD
ncbi:MAG: hypothetical protein FJX54_13500 [Alphaproteobacteria bacterium]|nr:hypothetical protein [Alphaproteobacteria bacterium]